MKVTTTGQMHSCTRGDMCSVCVMCVTQDPGKEEVGSDTSFSLLLPSTDDA